MARDDFSAPTRSALAKRVADTCSNPTCKARTSGPHTDPARALNVGVACHITAASPGGPRFDEKLSSDERSSIDNAVWLCQSCAKLVDNDPERFPALVLRKWKVETEAEALRALGGSAAEEFFPQPLSARHSPIPRIGGLPYDEARERLLSAGWQPRLHHFTHASNSDMQHGNGLHFWRKGYHEIISASGTGLAHCAFGFADVYQNRLVVVTAGEVIEERNYTAYVFRWYIEDDDA